MILALEVMSSALDKSADDKQYFLIAVLVLSVVGFAWIIIPPIFSYYKIRRIQAGTLHRWMEFFLSLFQLIIAIPAVFGFMLYFDLMEVLPLIVATITLLFGFRKDTNSTADLSQGHVRCCNCSALVISITMRQMFQVISACNG